MPPADIGWDTGKTIYQRGAAPAGIDAGVIGDHFYMQNGGDTQPRPEGQGSIGERRISPIDPRPSGLGC